MGVDPIDPMQDTYTNPLWLADVAAARDSVAT